MERSEIGGYFELPSPGNGAGSPHDGMLALNSARNCLVQLIRCKRIRRLHLPLFNCAVVEEAVRSFCPDTRIHHYHVDESLAPSLEDAGAVEWLYYVNYFGLKGDAVPRFERLVLDNAQAFYCPPLEGRDTIYCPRKFFGVADGGYLGSDANAAAGLEEDTSWEHATHLLKRIDRSAAAGYPDFQQAERALAGRPPARMSRLTKFLLAGIDHARVKATRSANFGHLHATLASSNRCSPIIADALGSASFVPFCYPYMTRNARALRAALIAERIYVPTYWPELQQSRSLDAAERAFVRDVVCLPIDQRYGEREMARILLCLRRHGG